MIERKFTHPAGDISVFNQLLIDVVQSTDDGLKEVSGLSHILGRIRDFFYFGSAFVYESDPMRHFVLKEHSGSFEHTDLAQSFILEDILSPEQIKKLSDDPWCCANQDLKHTTLSSILFDFFGDRSAFIVFITNDENLVVGCVGMVDKRRHEPLSDREYSQACALFKLIVERSRFRIYRQRLEYTTSTLENIMDHTGFDIYVNDFYTHEMLYTNESMAAPYGGWENMKDKTCHAALYDGQDYECSYCPKHQIIDSEGNPSKIYSWDYQRPFDGKWFHVISAAFEWVDGRLVQVVSSADINEAKHNELLIRQMAFSDQLTGIGNRRKLEQDLQTLLTQPGIQEKGAAILFLDLDGFKNINDTYGHNGGDTLLKHISTLFQENPLTADRCYRYGGDEFIFLFEGVSREDALKYSNEISALLETPLAIGNNQVSCKGSFGVSFYPKDGKDYWSLLDRADEAMYINKQKRKHATSAAAQS